MCLAEKIKMEVRNLLPYCIYAYLGEEEYRPKPCQEAEMIAKVLGFMKGKINSTVYIGLLVR